MSIMRFRVSSLLRIFCITILLVVGRGVFLQGQASQTSEQTEARDALNQGVQAYKNGHYAEAERLFARAKHLDPNLVNARLYLATTLASQFIPGAPSEENRRIGQQAVEEFRGVLQMDAQNLSAIDGIGSLLFQMAATPPANPDLFKESKSFHQKHTQMRPQDPEPYYWVGVIDWTATFFADRELRAKYNQTAGGERLAEVDPLPPSLQVRYAEESGATIDEGIDSLKKAISLRPDYDDAMAYLNLMYRRKADAVATGWEREQFTKMADELVDRVMEIKRKGALAQPSHLP